MRSSPFLFILITLMVLLDFYVFQAVKFVAQGAGPKTRSVVFISYWVLSVFAIVLLLVLPYLNLDNYSKGLRSTVFAIVAALFFAKFTAAIFLLMDDLRRGVQWVAGRFVQKGFEHVGAEGDAISRSTFLTWLGLAAGGGIFGSLVAGFSNKYNYHIARVPLSFSNLPQSFKGLKIVHISDIHSGSLTDRHGIQKGIEKILGQQPDLILFTGDLVNNKADEMEGLMDVFSQLKAPMGVFSTLGNHDYGDYVQWPDEVNGHSKLKVANLERLKKVHEELGWRLLLNEHVVLEKEGEKMALLGVENWSSKARFPKYGKLHEAYKGSEGIPFKILMSHDPSHWDAQVRTEYRDIDLMLAGHTHGMQFGVELPWFKWSPVQYVYKQWAGLYEQGVQKLYVNRGFGFIGYPGRVGILPEITVIELV